MSQSEKRRAKRVECLVPVEGKEGSPLSLSQTIDISEGGICIISSQKIPLNKQIAIELNLLETEEPVIVIGKVKWVKKLKDSPRFRIGFSFEDIRNGSKSRLKKYFKE